MALPTTITGLSTSPNKYSQPFISSGGNVYVVGRDTSTTSLIRAFKATDPTSSFSNVGTDFNLTSSHSLETLVAIQSGDNIHVATTDSSAGSLTILYHVFSMSSDSWTTTNESILGSTSVVNSSALSMLGISIRSDGDVIVTHNGSTDKIMGTDYDRAKYSRRESGSWTSDVDLGDVSASVNYYASGVVIGGSDRMHFFFVDDTNNDMYQRTLNSSNSLETLPSAFDTTVSTTELALMQLGVSYDSGGTIKVRYPISDATASVANSAKLDSNTDTPTVTQDTGITGATAVNTGAYFRLTFTADGTTLWHSFQAADHDLYTQSNADDAGWDAPVEFYDDAGALSGHRANIYTRGSTKVLAFVMTAGSSIKYHEKTLSAGTTDAAFDMDAAASVTWTGASTSTTNLDSDAAASVTWNGISTAASPFDSDAAASLTWLGSAIESGAWSSTATASLTWEGVEINVAEAAWSSTAQAVLTWNGESDSAANWSSTTTAALTWNGAADSASAWSSTATASLTWVGAADHASAWSSIAQATLTWQGSAIESGAWSSDATASVTWNGVELQVAEAAFDIDAAASVTWNGESDASVAWSSSAQAALTWNGESDVDSAWSATAAASLTWDGESDVDSDWSATAAASVTWNGAGVADAEAAFDMDAAASVTWNGEAIGASAWSSDAIATVTMASKSTASSIWSSDAAANLVMVSDANAAADWSSTAAANLVMTSESDAAGAWSSSAAASVTWDGEEIVSVPGEGDFNIVAAASVIMAAEATVESDFEISSSSSATFVGSTVSAEVSAITRDGVLIREKKRREMEAIEEEDILMLAALYQQYLEQNDGYY